VVERTQPDLSMRQTVKAIKPKVEEKLARVVSASLRNTKSPNARMTFDSAEKSKDKSRYPKKEKESKDKLKEPLMVVMHKEKDGETSKTNRSSSSPRTSKVVQYLTQKGKVRGAIPIPESVQSCSLQPQFRQRPFQCTSSRFWLTRKQLLVVKVRRKRRKGRK
jgi:hypothetical protein